MKTSFRHQVSPAAKITSGLCEEGRYIRLEQRGTTVVIFLNEAQAQTLEGQLPRANA